MNHELLLSNITVELSSKPFSAFVLFVALIASVIWALKLRKEFKS